jgi:hypothetical protein
MLASPDFRDFVVAQLARQPERKGLLESGRTTGASSKTAPMDDLFPSFAERIRAGSSFSVRGAGMWGKPAINLRHLAHALVTLTCNRFSSPL